MTISSEITRLQGAKSDIRQAIIDKGVSVSADLTIDDYACCIGCIKTGSSVKGTKYLIVGGGGGGGGSYYGPGGGGGGGEVLQGNTILNNNSYSITVGCCGQGGKGMASTLAHGCDGGSSIFNGITARGGKGGQRGTNGNSSYNWCSGGGGASGNGNSGGLCSTCSMCAGGGGGAGGCASGGCNCCNGGAGICVDGVAYGGGGGGGSSSGGSGTGCDGGGNGGNNTYGCNATSCGSGGGGGGYKRCGGNGACGIVKICYPTDGSYGITCATGGTKSTSGSYTVHTFTSNGTFCIVC